MQFDVSQLHLLGDRANQPRNHFLLSPTAIGIIGPSNRPGWFDR